MKGLVRSVSKRMLIAAAIIASIAAFRPTQSKAAGDPTGASLTIPGAPAVTAPPDAIFDTYPAGDREVARKFYKKYIDLKGLSVLASGEVADVALQRTHYIVSHMLAGRPDVLQAMADSHTRLIIIGKDQVYTDMPEYRNSRNPEYQNERVRGTGGIPVTSFGEENLLNLPLDRYDDESIGVHEFCHTIDSALGRVDSTWRARLRATFQNAIAKGRWHLSYDGSNQAEYWAEISQDYFDCDRPNNWNHASPARREQLKEYDPEGYELVRTTFNLTPDIDWHYTPLQMEPAIFPPPAKFKIDPYYTKFTWAREFTVIGSDKVSDEAMLKANDTIRKMFAYRHDILKAIINDGGKLVVLGHNEKLADLPEFKDSRAKPGFFDGRYYDYTPELKLMVVPEENVLNSPEETMGGESSVIRAMSKAIYQVCGTRAPDPNWDNRNPGIWQQYELRLKRIDSTFGDKLQKMFDDATEPDKKLADKTKKLWIGTPAAVDVPSYWAAGVEAYFEAAGRGYPAYGSDRPIVTREALKGYDPALFDLVDETFAYHEHDDWHFTPYPRQSIFESTYRKE